MSLELKHNPKLDLDIPEFCCDDNPIGSHLNEYPVLSYLNNYGCNCLLGRPASGKTSLLVSFLSGRGKKKVLRKCFNNVIAVMPSSSRNSMKKNIFENHPKEKMFETLDYDTITKISDMLHTSTAAKENTLLILDDIGAVLKSKEIQKVLRIIIYNRRHLKVQIWMLLQSYISCPLEIRKLFTNLFVFKPSKMEAENILRETLEFDKDLALKIIQTAYDKPHQWLMINVDSQRLFKGFDEIIIHKDGEEEKNILEK